MRLERLRPVVALCLATALTITLVPAPAWASMSGELVGRIVQADRVTVVEGVTVVLVDPQSMAEYRSLPTGEFGAFKVEAPAGTYVVLVETAEGAYLAADSLEVAAGTNAPLSVTLDAAIAAPSLAQSGSGLATWSKWLIVGGIAIGAAFAFDSVSDDKEPPSSPY